MPKLSYKTILSQDQNVLVLMRQLGLLSRVTEVKRVNHHPDYDFSQYMGPVTQTYFFQTTLSIPSDLSSAYDTEIMSTRVLHYDDFCRIIADLDLDADASQDQEWILAQALAHDEDFIDDVGYEELEQFSLRGLAITEIDNHARRVNLLGSFEGDSYGISQPDWALYAVVRFMGFKEDLNEADFYRQLLVESFLLREKGDYRVSFFLAFSALEGYINRKIDGDSDSGRLSEKARKLFLFCFPGAALEKNQIYTHAIVDFNQSLTELRNGIAHGRVSTIDRDQSRHMLLVALISICSAELQVQTFVELFPNG